MTSSDDSKKRGALPVVDSLFKKAVSLGASAYVSAEEGVKQTLQTVHIPKELLREAIEDFLKEHTIVVHAEIQLKPKKGEKT
jgi:hypothetical protein